MHTNRIQSESLGFRLPQPPAPAAAPAAFVLFTMPQGVALEQWMVQQWIYRQALEQAQAVARPSILERDLLAVWN